MFKVRMELCPIFGKKTIMERVGTIADDSLNKVNRQLNIE